MRIAVTGGGGFIGRHLVRALLDRGDDIVVLDNLRRGDLRALEPARSIQATITDQAACEDAFRDCAAVVHLAAQANVIGSAGSPAYTIDTNIRGTATVSLAAAEAGVGHIVFASSREVYGEPASLPVSEAQPLNPKNLYGVTKVSAELLLAQLPVPASILRFANVVGPGDSDRVIPRWLAAAHSGRPLELYGGAQVLDFVPVTTVVDAILRTIAVGPLDAPVNVGSGSGMSLYELAALIQQRIPGPSAIELMPARAIEVMHFVADTTRLRTILGIVPPIHPLNGLESWANHTPLPAEMA